MIKERFTSTLVQGIVSRIGALAPAKKKVIIETAAIGGSVTGIYLLTCLALVLCGVA